LDQMIELMIKAFDALKRIKELEAEAVKYRNEHDALVKQIELLEEREKKRKRTGKPLAACAKSGYPHQPIKH